MMDLKSKKTFFSNLATVATISRLTNKSVATFMIIDLQSTQLKFPYYTHTLTEFLNNPSYSILDIPTLPLSKAQYFYYPMQAYVNEHIRKHSVSVDIQHIYKKCLFFPKDNLNFIRPPKNRQKHKSSDMPYKHVAAHLSQSQEILIIKQQIQKLRTETPHILIKESENQKKAASFLCISKSRKRDELTKIVLTRLKREKSKEYLRKIKKSESFLPKLDMSGKSCWLPNKQRYIVSTQQPEENPELFPMNSIVKIKNRLKPRPEKSHIASSKIGIEPTRDRSVSGWGRVSNAQDISQLLME